LARFNASYSIKWAHIAQDYSRSHDAVIRVYDDAGNVIETHEHASGFKEPWNKKPPRAETWRL